jgi:hypothetical protein
MQHQSVLSTWKWVLKYWIALYAILFTSGLVLSLNFMYSFYWILFLVLVPIVVIPTTYTNLVGGGCSLRFQICAMVKGVVAGFILYLMTAVADVLLWGLLSQNLAWTPLSELSLLYDVYLVILISGMIGGIGARIMEVRGQTQMDTGTMTPIIREEL